MKNGICKWFSKELGYGFIIQDDGPDVFAHHKEIQGENEYKFLEKNDECEFNVQESEKGPQAVNVRVINALGADLYDEICGQDE